MRRGIDISRVTEDVSQLPSRSSDEINKYVPWLAGQLWRANMDHFREFGHELVCGEEGKANIEQATLELLQPRFSHMQGSKKHPVRVWPSALEAWMQAEVVAAGIAGANEHSLGNVIDQETEDDLRERLAAAALGMTLENFLLMQGA